ncbi:cupin [Tistrella bauzanensis]|uniref:Cupin n=1 Tax=Tistrella bauzanensis TaxID=657419 RepID=A0ABQ1IQ52_9PROT|nr:cupin domain-containing protein [Tistrella bauzanensis]GGB49253.1 cupin [Tistrella bauzanensis]
MLKTIRRIVTANTADGRSRILSDGPSPHMLESAPARGLIDMWAMTAGGPDTKAPDGADRPIVLAPAVGGNTFRIFQLPPAGSGDGDRVLSASVFERMGAADAHDADGRHPNMHCTRSIDYIVLLSGRVKLILDEDETILEPFDVVIQRETNHAWENLSDHPAQLIAVLIDTTHTA